MFCFQSTYKRVLERLRRIEQTTPTRLFDYRLDSNCIDDSNAFELEMETKGYVLRTKFDHRNKFVNILFVIWKHLYYVNQILEEESTEIYFDNSHFVLSDYFLEGVQIGLNEQYGDVEEGDDRSQCEYDGDDYADILDKYQHTNFNLTDRQFELLFTGMNDRELLRFMKVSSYYHGHENDDYICIKQIITDKKKIFDIERIYQMNEDIQSIYENKEMNIKKRKLLKFIFYDYIRNGKEDEIIYLIHKYGIHFFTYCSKVLFYIIKNRMKNLFFKLYDENIYSFQNIILYIYKNNGEYYENLIDIFTLTHRLVNTYSLSRQEDIEKKRRNLILLYQISESKEEEDLIQYIKTNPHQEYRITSSFMKAIFYKSFFNFMEELISKSYLSVEDKENMEVINVYENIPNHIFQNILSHLSISFLIKINLKKDMIRDYIIENILSNKKSSYIKFYICDYLLDK